MTVRTATRLFLGHAPDDRGLARLVGERLDRAGFDVGPFTTRGVDEAFEVELQTALTSVDQVAFLVTRQFATSQIFGIELGAARMTRKPIYVLYDGMSDSDLPDYLGRFPCYPVDEIARFIDETARAA